MPKPMLTDDYIIRMINQAIAVLLTITRLKAVGQYQEAQQYIDQSLEQLIGLRVNLIKGLDDRNVLNTLTINGVLDTDRIIIVADLYNEEGDILAAQNKMNESYRSYHRALYFYLMCALNGGPQKQPNPDKKIEKLAGLMRNVNYPIETEILLSEYFERSGKYAEGYQVLIKLSANQNYQEEIIRERKAFLERVLIITDGEFVEGWLTRDKIKREIAILQGEMQRLS